MYTFSCVKYPAGHYLFRNNNGNIRTLCKICSNLTIKTREWHHWRLLGVFIIIFKQISNIVLLFHSIWMYMFSISNMFLTYLHMLKCVQSHWHRSGVLLLFFNRFHSLFWSFHYWLIHLFHYWTSKYWLGTTEVIPLSFLGQKWLITALNTTISPNFINYTEGLYCLFIMRIPKLSLTTVR